MYFRNTAFLCGADQYFITTCKKDADFTFYPYGSLDFYFKLKQTSGDKQILFSISMIMMQIKTERKKKS